MLLQQNRVRTRQSVPLVTGSSQQLKGETGKVIVTKVQAEVVVECVIEERNHSPTDFWQDRSSLEVNILSIIDNLCQLKNILVWLLFSQFSNE